MSLSKEEESRLYFSKTKKLLQNDLERERESQEDWKRSYFALSQAIYRDVFTPIILSKRFHTKLLLTYTSVDPSKNNNAALIYACEKNLTSVAILLLSDKRVDPGARCGQSLLIACELANEKLVTALLKHRRVDPNAQEAACLMSAVTSADQEIVQLLLDSGAISKENKKRALLWANKCRHRDIEGTIQSHLRPLVKIATYSKRRNEQPVDYSIKIDRESEQSDRSRPYATLFWIEDN